MKFHQTLLAIIGITMAATLAQSSFALPVMDIRIDDLVLQANNIKASLNMTPNQVMLWQQVQTKVRTIVQVRQSRRQQLQEKIRTGLGYPDAELRDMAKKIDVEEDLTNQENKQLRELWLTMNDALDDKQRQLVLDLLMDQLQRSAYEKTEASKPKGDGHGRGMGRQRLGGGVNGGMP